MILETERLLLRNFKYDDLDLLYKYRNEPNCAKYQSWDDTSREYLQSFIKEEKNKIVKGETLQLAISLKNNNELIGDTYIAFKNKTITLGYTISPQHQRKGYAYEILQSIISHLFKNFDDHEIVCMVHPDNEASKMLLEKLNFENEGYLKEIDSLIYSLHNLI
jgi:RimJ/RimL family protein N-acetyltransferase